MSITYTFEEQNDNLNPEGNKKKGMYPKMIKNRTVFTNELAKNAAIGSTVNYFEIETIITMLMDQIESELKDGNNVCINGFGTFTLSLKSKLVQSTEEIRAESISVKRVVFKPSPAFTDRFVNAEFKKLAKTKRKK